VLAATVVLELAASVVTEKASESAPFKSALVLIAVLAVVNSVLKSEPDITLDGPINCECVVSHYLIFPCFVNKVKFCKEATYPLVSALISICKCLADPDNGTLYSFNP